MTARLALVLALALFVGACSFPEKAPDGDGPGSSIADPGAIPDAVPQPEPRSRYGNPESYVVFGKRYTVMDSAEAYRQRGIASWYGTKFHGRRTSSGEPYDMYAMTAAHKRLPLPTYVRVTHLENGRSIVVKVNDRGPFADNRIIDLSFAAASKLGMVDSGTAPVEVVALTASATNPVRRASLPGEPAAVSSDVRYFLQVGAFGERDNALRTVGRLEAANLAAPVRLESAERFHRVQVGPVADVEGVDALTEQLGANGFADVHVVVE